MKYSIGFYLDNRYILAKYILPFCFGNLNPCDYQSCSSVLSFSGFLTVSYHFPRYFRRFLPVFLQFLSVFPLIPHSFPCFLFYISYFHRRQLNGGNKDTLTQVFSCKFCEISKNIFFTEHLRAVASDINEVLASLEVRKPTFSWCYSSGYWFGN